ncbi:MAG TPA: hypothetical protein VFK89_03590 [Actinomycetota bacterium]|nr:hypothetical protein [Actinomycetota bacterium]
MGFGDGWATPPGAPTAPRSRRALKVAISSFLVGALSLGMAWAGTALAPVNATKRLAGSPAGSSTGKAFVATTADAPQPSAGSGYTPADLQPGQILAGAAKVSLYPRPEDYKGEFPDADWTRNEAQCEITDSSGQGIQAGLENAADLRVKWPEAKNCLYMGGYGIGPMNSIDEWDNDYGLWARSVAMQDRDGDTLVLTLIDAIYWEAHYDSLCPGDPCGFLDLAQQLSDETGLPPESFVFASTHSHTSIDFIGGWGAVPDWYMQQATDSLKAAALDALGSLQPAVLEAGESIVRNRNGERRDYYYSAEDNNESWFRLIDADNQPHPEVCTTPTPTPSPSPTKDKKSKKVKPTPTPTPAPTPTCEPASPGRAIATVGAYAAHPVTEDESGGQADADFPAVFAKSVEDSYGGVGMFLQTGLGNMSPRGNKIDMGTGLAGAIPAIGGGTQITNTDLKIARKSWVQPATNGPLTTLGRAGFFDRTFNETPAAVHVGKGPENKKCNSASPLSVETSVSAAKVGNLLITGGPGELFSNLSNTIEERNPNGITLALGLVNDGLGYIMQSFETDHLGRQGTGFVGSVDQDPAPEFGIAEYEDAYSIDHCFGDATLQYTIDLINQLNS